MGAAPFARVVAPLLLSIFAISSAAVGASAKGRVGGARTMHGLVSDIVDDILPPSKASSVPGSEPMAETAKGALADAIRQRIEDKIPDMSAGRKLQQVVAPKESTGEDMFQSSFKLQVGSSPRDTGAGMGAHDEIIHGDRHLQEADHEGTIIGPSAIINGHQSSHELGSSNGGVRLNNVRSRKLLDQGPGRCGVHVTQYQIPPGPGNFYSIAATVKNRDGLEIGHVGKTTADGPVSVDFNLDVGPTMLAMGTPLPGSVPDTDAEPVGFALTNLDTAGDQWSSNDGRCSVGVYDSGKREMDCGFVC